MQVERESALRAARDQAAEEVLSLAQTVFIAPSGMHSSRWVRQASDVRLWLIEQ